MRFYVPEWEDHVDAEYDFVTDEHSVLGRSDRNLAYIWDIFDRDPAETPIDGILISREQIEESPERARRLQKYGVYDAPNDGTTLAVPEWLPTISDCGAWGYKALPFPPYGNKEMLDFYEDLNVDVGVTIDHLVLGSGHTARLYIDESAFGPDFSKSDLPAVLTKSVDVMVADWPETWPSYVEAYESSITRIGPCSTSLRDLLDISVRGVDPEEDSREVAHRVKKQLRTVAGDPRIVYRDNDTEFRYDLTLNKLRETRELYDAEDYSFRLMCAIQGWDTASYANATRSALSAGYDYLGIGGVAGSREKDVKRYVSAVGGVVKDYERAYQTRVDTHVFGFAKTGAFETIGRSGMSSFDSASMFRAAWTGGQNYHLDPADGDRRYDAIRVRYPSHQGDISGAIEAALWSQEMLATLRAFDRRDSLIDAIREWYSTAANSLEYLEPHLEDQRWDDHYNQWRIRDMKEAFRTHYEYGGLLKANFSDRFRKRVLKLLRQDDPADPIDFEKYTELIDKAWSCLEVFPQTVEVIEDRLNSGAMEGSFTTIWAVVEAYTAWAGDEGNRDGYRELLIDRPWDECGCPVCTELGIDVAIFRGNNRNRRRGFHNTQCFYDQFEEDLPKLLVVTKGDSSLTVANTVEEFLTTNRLAFWEQVHDLPVAEIGVVTAHGIHEWWEAPPSRLSFVSGELEDRLEEHCRRYQNIFIDGQGWDVSAEIRSTIETVDCDIHVFDDPRQLRRAVLDRLQYDERTIPPHPKREEVDQIGISDF